MKRDIVTETLSTVHIARVDRNAAKYWNSRKQTTELSVYCGWYWMRGDEEAGPFHTRSACVRDAYYHFVLHRAAPTIRDSVRGRMEGSGAIGLRARRRS